jgi:UDP-GlcNAc:undecaprenyl-phosphate/decaprenyl-phosphate GlcNAc-1-phosphate transferase
MIVGAATTLVFLLALGVAAAATPLVRGIARRHQWSAAPTADRWHVQPTPLYGGVAIFAGILAGALALVWWYGTADGLGVIAGEARMALAIGGAACFLFCVGVADDRLTLAPMTKAIAQLAAGVLLVSFGVVLPLTPWVLLNVAVTLFWFTGITNALNLLDNMDGVAAGVAAIAGAVFCLLFVLADAWLLAGCSLALTGAALGFLCYNFKPASIFMGDGGSLLLGSALAGLGVAAPLAMGAVGAPALLMPLFVLLLPVVDTSLVTFTRTMNNRRISEGGRDHTAHRLVSLGLSERETALTLYAFALSAGMLALWLPTGNGWSGAGTLLFLAGALLVLAYLTRLHRYETAERAADRRVTLFFRHLLYKRQALELLLDCVLFGVAYYAAFLVYYDGVIPQRMVPTVYVTLPIVVVARLAAFQALGIYRTAWERLSGDDVVRIGKATALGSLLMVGVLFLAFRSADIARSVFLVEALLAGLLGTVFRFSFRSLNQLQNRRRSSGEPALIVGTGEEAESAYRLLVARDSFSAQPVAFLDPACTHSGELLHGLPVFGATDALAIVLRDGGVRHVVLASESTDGELLRMLQQACASANVALSRLTVALAPVRGMRVPASTPSSLTAVRGGAAHSAERAWRTLEAQ